MRIRLKLKEEIENAYKSDYTNEEVVNIVDFKSDSKPIKSIDKVPNELFLVLTETLSFIEEVNDEEGRN